MRKFVGLLGVLAIVATAIVVGQAPASAAPLPWSSNAGVDAQLKALQQSGTTLTYRRAAASDRMIDGLHVVPAAAAKKTPQSRCSGGYICLYPDANGAGYVIYVASGRSIPDLGTACSQGICYAFNDHLSSWENPSGWTYCWHYDSNYGGAGRLMPYYAQLLDLSAFGTAACGR